MSTLSYIMGIVGALLVLGIVFEMLRQRRLRERYVVWWVVAGVGALILAVFPQILIWLAALIGVAVPANLVFFASIAILFLVCIQYAVELSRAEERSRRLSERLALLEIRVDELDRRAEERREG